MKFLVVLAAFVLSAQFVFAANLTVVPETPGVSVISWDFREISTKKFPGCWQYDFLQGTGWYPRTWYKNYLPVPVEESYVFSPKQTLTAKYCSAKMDQYNYVNIQKVTENSTLNGQFSIVPDGLTAEVNIYCTTSGESLVCENAHVLWEPSKTATVHVIVD